MSWLTFWIATLACYRATILIVRCLGPWDIFARLREIDRCSKLLTCVYCVSVYMGSLMSFGLWLSGIREPWPVWFMLPFAFSSVTIALDRVFSSDHQPK